MEGSQEVGESIEIPSERIRYTRFIIDSLPKDLRQDLRFSPGAPWRDRLSAAWLLHPSSFRIGLGMSVPPFLLISLLSAWIATLPSPRDKRPSRRATLLIGLANLLGIFGILAASGYHARRRALGWQSGVALAVRMSFVFCALLLGLAILMPG